MIIEPLSDEQRMQTVDAMLKMTSSDLLGIALNATAIIAERIGDHPDVFQQKIRQECFLFTEIISALTVKELGLP